MSGGRTVNMLDPMRWLDEADPLEGVHFAGSGGSWDVWSYEQLAVLARQTAAGLCDVGVGPGDRVLLVQPSGPTFVGVFFGAWIAGATVCPAAPPQPFQDGEAYASHLRALVRSSRARCVVTTETLVKRITEVFSAHPSSVQVLVDAALPRPVAPGDHPSTVLPEVPLVQFTSGSSGPAKAVAVPASALRANITAIADWLGHRRWDDTVSWLPVHHDMGLVGCLLTPLSVGGGLWLLRPEDFLRSPMRYLQCVAERRGVLSAMPTFGLEHVVRRVRREDLLGLDLGRWRTLIVGAERVDASVLKSFRALLAPTGFAPAALAPAYGLAEATLAVTGRRPGGPWRSLRIDASTLRSSCRVQETADEAGSVAVTGCGTPLQGVDVSVRDDSGQRLPERVVGEISVSGATVAGPYLGDVDRSAVATSFQGERLRTGDIGFLDAGELFVLGRLGDSLKVRGRSIFAEDLEGLLVDDFLPLRKVAVVLGEEAGQPTARVVVESVSPGIEEEVRRRLTPRLEGVRLVVHLVRAGTIPRTTSGKPRRRVLWASGASFAEPSQSTP